VSDVTVALIAAVAANGVIGAGGAMPWRLSTDLRRFKALTTGHPVIMGRATFESIGKPLPGRLNIVVSGQDGFRPEGVTVATSPEAALERARNAARHAGIDAVFVIGGARLYAATLPLADMLHITHVEASPEGDTWFPAIDSAIWEPVSEERQPAGPKDTAATVYTVYRRRGDPPSR
jgi:dihydrofolate reductase